VVIRLTLGTTRTSGRHPLRANPSISSLTHSESSGTGGFTRWAQHLLEEVFVLGRPALPRKLQRRFWLMMRPDVVQDEGAATVSVSKAVAWRWFRQAGGVLPALLPDHPESAARTFRLSFSERKRSASCAPPARAFGHRAGI